MTRLRVDFVQDLDRDPSSGERGTRDACALAPERVAGAEQEIGEQERYADLAGHGQRARGLAGHERLDLCARRGRGGRRRRPLARPAGRSLDCAFEFLRRFLDVGDRSGLLGGLPFECDADLARGPGQLRQGVVEFVVQHIGGSAGDAQQRRHDKRCPTEPRQAQTLERVHRRPQRVGQQNAREQRHQERLGDLGRRDGGERGEHQDGDLDRAVPLRGRLGRQVRYCGRFRGGLRDATHAMPVSRRRARNLPCPRAPREPGGTPATCRRRNRHQAPCCGRGTGETRSS